MDHPFFLITICFFQNLALCDFVDLRLYHMTQRDFLAIFFSAIQPMVVLNMKQLLVLGLASLAIISRIRRPPVGSPVPGREVGG